MNLNQLSKNIGQLRRLRPKARRVDGSGKHLEVLDDQWRLEGIYAKPNRIALVNIHTGHGVELQSDNVKQFQSPDFLILKCQLTVTPSEVEIEPLPPTGRQILPIARYQVKGRPSITEVYVPFRAVICDGCTASVQFRPLTRIQLMSADDPAELAEQFCPPCARKRDIAVHPPEGMADDVLFADLNPTFRYHVSRTLRHWGLRVLSTDPDLKAAGVANVGAAITGRSVILIVTGGWPQAVEIPLKLHELENIQPASDHALFTAMKVCVVARLAAE